MLLGAMMLLTDDTITIPPKRHDSTIIQGSQGGRIVTLFSSHFQTPYVGCGTLCIHQHTLSMLLQQVGVEYADKNVSVSVVLVDGDDHGSHRGILLPHTSSNLMHSVTSSTKTYPCYRPY